MKALRELSVIALFATVFTVNAGESLDLNQALELALKNDSLVSGFVAQQDAWHQLSYASQTWEDPTLRFGAQAVPVDTFDLDQEPMTQLVVGYQQMFPRGEKLKNNADIMQANAGVEAGKVELRKRQVVRDVKKSWYEVWYRQQALKIIQSNRKIFEEMLDINQSFYASGRTDQQSVVQAELDISLLDDKLQTMQSELMVSQESLIKWLGIERVTVNESLPEESSNLTQSVEILQSGLKNHPLIKQANEKLNKRKSELALTQDKYSVQWGMDVRYGYRQGENNDGSDRADFLTAMVTVDLPVFTEQRQDRQVAASRSEMHSARYQKIDVERELLKQLKQTHVRLLKFKQRLALYSEKINPQAKQNAEVAMRGYQSGVVDFITLSKAQVTEFNTSLAELKLKYQFNKTMSDLEYLVGDEK
ncbi:MAG: hypothetical protein DIZ80_08415 [endosymbiont of Galathealinum brachiosum]|uniref:TolC family protein n=1 Tax=endosymbiont of Galathealinum brachiosum TaxID=2200906 RepID=A0A370DD54_9GAMM|nr:MAG: hypothetical protein DIZ80_08415 [endosymbiont of Galathealinum brachiosum]